MFDNATGGPVVTIGLVVIVFVVCGVVLATSSWINRRIGRVEKRCLEAVAALRTDIDGRFTTAATSTGALAEQLAAFKLEIARDYLSRDGARELLQPFIDEMRLRFDQLDEKITLKRRPPAATRVTPGRRKRQAQQG